MVAPLLDLVGAGTIVVQLGASAKGHWASSALQFNLNAPISIFAVWAIFWATGVCSTYAIGSA